MTAAALTISRRARIVTTVVAVVVAALLFTAARDGGTGRGSASAAEPAVVRPDSHRLSTAADGRVTLVEFLDFECEGCRAMFPVMERLREQYRDRVGFVVRYFPLPGHFNAERAARAVEAAAAQGRFEQMYRRMFADFDEGLALGVQGTPPYLSTTLRSPSTATTTSPQLSIPYSPESSISRPVVSRLSPTESRTRKPFPTSSLRYIGPKFGRYHGDPWHSSPASYSRCESGSVLVVAASGATLVSA